MSTKPDPIHDSLQSKEQPVPSYREAGLPPKFGMLVLERQELNEQIKDLEGKKDVRSAEILEMLAMSGQRAVQVDEYRPMIVDSTRRTISAEKLLELGVPVTTIEAATVVSHSTSLRVFDGGARKLRDQERASGVQPIKSHK